MPLLILFGAFILIHVIHALTLSRTIQYKEIVFHSAKITKQIDGYRIALITDVHDASERRLIRIVKNLNASAIDALILGGDFSENPNVSRASIEILAKIKTTHGIFGVDGNHDNHEELFAAMRNNDIFVLSNSGVHVHENLYIAGLEDLWNRHPNVKQATSNATPNDFVLLISHNPDTLMMQDPNADLTLCGHTHGGQVNLFGIWAPHLTFANNISKYGQRFRSGWCKARNGAPVFVSNGIAAGTTGVPRVFARPQVVVITLKNKL